MLQSADKTWSAAGDQTTIDGLRLNLPQLGHSIMIAAGKERILTLSAHPEADVPGCVVRFPFRRHRGHRDPRRKPVASSSEKDSKISARSNNQSLVWGQAAQLKSGSNSVTLDLSNAIPID
jgi:hypothetical protein